MAGDQFNPTAVQLWIYNGNGRAEKLIKSWEASEFQASLAAQHSSLFKMTVGAYVAALGSRGDYFLLRIPCVHEDVGLADDAEEYKAYLEFMDILGVPNDVQLAKVHGYGKHSPFDSPDIKVTDEMKVGIEAEKLSFLNNVAADSLVTPKTQKVAGVDDTRITALWETVVPATGVAASTPLADLLIKFKPSASGVFLIRYDSGIWIDPADGFVEFLD